MLSRSVDVDDETIEHEIFSVDEDEEEAAAAAAEEEELLRKRKIV